MVRVRERRETSALRNVEVSLQSPQSAVGCTIRKYFQGVRSR